MLCEGQRLESCTSGGRCCSCELTRPFSPAASSAATGAQLLSASAASRRGGFFLSWQTLHIFILTSGFHNRRGARELSLDRVHGSLTKSKKMVRDALFTGAVLKLVVTENNI